jgi:trimeric autotransporter adhesin
MKNFKKSTYHQKTKQQEQKLHPKSKFRMYFSISLSILITFYVIPTYGQVVIFTPNGGASVNSTSNIANSSAMLDVSAANKGLLIPRVQLQSNTDVNTILTPAKSLLVYNVAPAGNVIEGFYYWNGTMWVALGGGEPAWLLLGNAGTNPNINFMGTTDNVDVVFRRNNLRAGLLNGTNTSWGSEALANNIAIQNTAVGVLALNANNSGNYNASFGHKALSTNLTGSQNTATGNEALTSNTFGNNNTATGYRSLFYNTTGINNTGVGKNSLLSNTVGGSNTAVGHNALHNNIGNNTSTHEKGNGNTGIGAEALFSNDDGSSNTAIGYNSLYHNKNNDNTSIGKNSLRLNTGSKNTAVGSWAGNSMTTGDNNIIIGAEQYSALTLTGSNQLNIGGTIFGVNMGTLATNRIGIGTGTTTPNATLQINGSVSASAVRMTALNYIVQSTDYFIHNPPTPNNNTFSTITLPGGNYNGRILIIANNRTVQINTFPYRFGANLLIDIPADTRVTLINDGTEWVRVN